MKKRKKMSTETLFPSLAITIGIGKSAKLLWKEGVRKDGRVDERKRARTKCVFG
jgi:hypothetical protein